MKPFLKILISILVLNVVLVGSASKEAYGKYPEKMITWVVPFSAGGGTDRWARIMSSVAIDHFGQPWHVVNIPGASALAGWKEVLNRPANGYSILQASDTPVIALLKEAKPPLSPFDIKIVCYISSFRSVLVSKPGKEWSTWEGFKAYAKKNPGKITVAGTESNIMGQAFMLDQAGIKVTLVPYASTGDAVADFLGGHVDAVGATVSTVKPLIPQNAMAVVNTSDIPISEKIKEFKGVPSARDLGYEGMSFARWVGVHPDTPDEIAEFISEKMGSLLKDKVVTGLMKKVGEEIIYLPRAKAQADYKKAVQALKKAITLLK